MNRLNKEKSPYLLQHKNNPVDWYPWGEEAFLAAKEQDKPIFLSIGYSSCYWCHVMEQESFESEKVAKILNEHFISIKVDREERPDIDQIYMDAALSMTGHGGWPLSAFLTAELKPFFAATYFPQDKFIALLNKINHMWQENKDELTSSANEITTHLNKESILGKAEEINSDIFEKLYAHLLDNYDDKYGGFGPAPKFPPTFAIRNLLRIYKSQKSEKALEMATNTLEKMAKGGIFDHLGGGFARYSVDERWLIPHFEKMLYDNALLITAYLEAYQITKKEIFKDVSLLTIKYLMKEMYSEAFYSAQDAGDVGKEGEYYVWSLQELEDLLEEKELESLKENYGISDIGNFEHGLNVLNLTSDWEARNNKEIKTAFEKLSKERNQRRAPHLDDKILTSWNALTISALVKASQVLEEPGYYEIACKTAEFIKNKLYKNNKLLRRYRDGESGINACLDDYSYLIQALIDLYEHQGETSWLEFAIELQKDLDQNFWSDNAYHFANPDSKELIFRKKDLVDNATPSGNGTSIFNLFRLYYLTMDKSYEDKAIEIVLNAMPMAQKYPAGFNSMILALDFYLNSPLQIVSAENKELKELVQKEFTPNKVIAWKKSEDFPQIVKGKETDKGVFICKDNTCQAPLSEISKIKEQMGIKD